MYTSLLCASRLLNHDVCQFGGEINNHQRAPLVSRSRVAHSLTAAREPNGTSHHVHSVPLEGWRIKSGEDSAPASLGSVDICVFVLRAIKSWLRA